MMLNIILPIWQWLMENRIVLEAIYERLYFNFC